MADIHDTQRYPASSASAPMGMGVAVRHSRQSDERRHDINEPAAPVLPPSPGPTLQPSLYGPVKS